MLSNEGQDDEIKEILKNQGVIGDMVSEGLKATAQLLTNISVAIWTLSMLLLLQLLIIALLIKHF